MSELIAMAPPMPINEPEIETTDIRATADHFISEAKERIDANKKVLLTIIAVQAHRVILMYPPFRNDEEKVLMIGLAMTVAVRNPDTIAVISISDCWIDETNEVLATAVSVRGQKPFGIMNPYRREGKNIIWGKQEDSPVAEGRLVAEFPETTTH